MKECIECKYCSVEDLYYELICLKHHKQLCPTKIIDGETYYDIYYPACEEFEEEQVNNKIKDYVETLKV